MTTPTPTPVLITGCSVCHSKDRLSLCAGCKVVKYCGVVHQREHRPSHKTICKTIVKKTAILVQERKETAFFNAHGGGLSAILGSGSLVDPLLQLAQAQLQVDTQTAVQSGLSLLLEMVDITKDPRTGPPDLVPALFLRLGRDQEAYDFMKWWVTSPAPKGLLGPSAQPYADSKDSKADVFEDVDFFKGKCPSLSFMVALTLLKLRLLIDLQALQRSAAIGENVPREILDEIRSHLTSSAVSANKAVLERDDHTPDIKNLTKQVRTMYAAVQEGNSHFWPAVLHPGPNTMAWPESWNFGNKQEMQLALRYTYKAWLETPGAIEAIEELEGGKVDESQ
ncbi:hypothetical protein K505DRAFT_326597 [Melanomma pulvis-pyrius CBS 109.77]|uniref:MYND-type domain-containing protein n=1 Tax=Melanomma pulvis-pyrius CBS 109.77 TaxID=1314802 RepID=A0A6A6X6B8_9PLEO|nr:hypothetical protein K505DRAFT_326597 [Melanomma pulvis-pyrius CBS 109.77]